MRLTAVLLSLAIAWADPPKLPEPYRSLVELAHTAPPEFASDALLRVVESGKIADRDSRLALVEEAFRLGSVARFRLPLRAFGANLADTAAGSLDQAYRLKLDALTLQSRAVRDMLALDKAKARELFDETQPPAMPPLTCADVLVPEVSAYYETLGAIVQNTFTEKERAKEEHVNFLLSQLARVTSPAQLAPAVKLVAAVSLTPAQHDAVLARINAILESLQPDGRSFSATANDLKAAILPEMSASYEKYLQRGPAGERCSDSPANTIRLGANLSQPAKLDDSPKIERYWQSGEAKQIYEKALALRMGPVGKMLSAADRATPEWKAQLTDFLKDLGAWTASSEKSPATYFHEKCAVYEALLDLTPEGPQRDETLANFVGFLVGSNLQQDSPVEWFVHAPQLLERMKSAGGSAAEKVLEAYRSSGNPVLLLFATLEKTFGSKLPAWVTTGASTN